MDRNNLRKTSYATEHDAILIFNVKLVIQLEQMQID